MAARANEDMQVEECWSLPPPHCTGRHAYKRSGERRGGRPRRSLLFLLVKQQRMKIWQASRDP
eukprot:136765-Hanusia_phi.AAC.2